MKIQCIYTRNNKEDSSVNLLINLLTSTYKGMDVHMYIGLKFKIICFKVLY